VPSEILTRQNTQKIHVRISLFQDHQIWPEEGAAKVVEIVRDRIPRVSVSTRFVTFRSYVRCNGGHLALAR
jgi:hypothetical protein